MVMKYTKETRGEFIVLAICLLTALCFVFFEIMNTVTTVDNETKILVNETVLNISAIKTIHADHLRLLRSRAEELFAEKFSEAETFKKRLVNVKDKEWELIPVPGDTLSEGGRITGTGNIEQISPEKLHEIYVSEKLTNLFTKTRTNLPNSPFVYYISKADFWNITPRHLEAFSFFIPEYHGYDLYTFGLPENNAQKNIFWTKPYIDAGGNGLMVTAGIPLYHKGEFKGTICIDMLFKDIANYLKSNTFSNRNISLIDNFSQVVSSTFQHLAPPDTIPTLRHLVGDERNNIRLYDLNRFSWYKNNRIFISAIPNSQWYIFHFNTRAEFLTLVIIRILPAVAAVLFLLVIIYLLLYANRLRIENEAAKIKAEKANATKNKFLSIIAHDLRSPFTYLLGFADLMNENFKENNLTGQKEIFEHIDNGIKNLYKLLDNLLLWARIQQDGISFNPTETLLLPAAKETIEPLLQAARNKSIQIVSNIPEDIVVFADKSMLSTIIRNLISNAIKFTPQLGSITLTASRKDMYAEISIADSGVGIPPELLVSLFTTNEKISTKGTDGESGSGLGLLLCKEFVEMHKGKIWAESVAGNGSTFCFTIPIQPNA